MSANPSEIERQEQEERLTKLLRDTPNYRDAIESSTEPETMQRVNLAIENEERKAP